MYTNTIEDITNIGIPTTKVVLPIFERNPRIILVVGKETQCIILS